MPSIKFSPLTVDPKTDDLKPVVELLKDLTGRRPSPATIWRWCSKGTKRGGRLPAFKVLGTWHSTRAALLQWLAAESDRTDSHAVDRPSGRDPSTKKRLTKAGLINCESDAERLEGEGA